jgi:YD repeat-containing protein
LGSTYDAIGRVSTVTSPHGAVTSVTYSSSAPQKTETVNLLGNETKAEFEDLVSAYVARFNPADEVERRMVHQYAALDFRLRRAVNLGDAAIDQHLCELFEENGGVNPVFSGEAAIIVSLGRDHTKTHLIDLFSRMEAHLARQAHRLLTDFLKLQAIRLSAGTQPQPAASTVQPSPTTEPQPSASAQQKNGETNPTRPQPPSPQFVNTPDGPVERIVAGPHLPPHYKPAPRLRRQ